MQVSLRKGSHSFQPLQGREEEEEEKQAASGGRKDNLCPLGNSFSSFGPNESTCLSVNAAELMLKCEALERKLTFVKNGTSKN